MDISYRANATGREDGSRAQREKLHALSNARKEKWGNTLEAMRGKKERARQEKLDTEETLRKAIDHEEEGLQAEKRRLAIERANKMLYDSTDRVKALHSKLMLCDVLQERERQLELKKTAKQREKVNEERWYQKQQDAIRRMDAEEDAHEAEAAMKREELSYIRSEQVEERRQQHNAKLEDRRKDGELMKDLALADLETEKIMREKEEYDAQRMRDEFVEANHYLMKAKDEEQMIIEAEEQRMVNYAQRKEHDLMERREREAQRFNDRQTWRQKLIDEQIAKLQDVNAMQNARLEAQAVEVQSKAMEARARLDEKKKDELLVTHMSRQQQMRWKAEKAAQGEAESEYFTTQLKKLNEQLREEEAQAIRDKFMRARDNQGFLLAQMSQKRDKVMDERTEEMIQAEMSKQWMGDDDAIFEQYATLCLDEYKQTGKSTKPVELLLQKELNSSKLTF